jgi:NitT/TauT family transport system ATP-binding protein
MTQSTVITLPADQPPEGSVLSIRDLSKTFGRGTRATVALDGVNMDVKAGEFVTIVGASGCGKSTLLSIIAGLEKPTSGTVQANGKVSLMFQEATLLPWLTASRNVELALRLSGVPRADRPARATELLELVRLTDYADKRPHELSGGMRQRVALARVLAQDAKIVLMDEPLGALDAMTRDRMHDEIERIWSSVDLTVLFVTHNMREAVRLGDRVVLMSSSPGRIKLEERIDLPRPRVIDSSETAAYAATLTEALREEVAAHVR